MDQELVLQIVGAVLGLLYLWLEYKANIWLWVVGAIMPMVHGVMFLNKGIYADAAMQLYNISAGIYGFFVWWLGSKRANKRIDIQHTPKRWIFPLVATYLVLHAALYYVLNRFTDSGISFFDSMSTSLCIVAMFMLSRKFVEQWLVWLVVDMISVGLYLYKGIPITAMLYALYCVLAIAGYMRWRRQVLIKS